MSDFEGATEQLLTIPPDFVPYMEKHRLYEFFYVTELHLAPIRYFIDIDYVTMRCVLYFILLGHILLYFIILYYKKIIGISDAITDPATGRPISIYETMHPTHRTKARYSQSYSYSSSKLW